MMRTYFGLPFLALLTLGCVSPVQIAHLSQERMEKGAAITLQVSQPDPVGVEHALAQELQRAGYDVRSANIVAGLNYKLQTPYICKVRTTGWRARVHTFSLQLIRVDNGRILLSMNGSGDGYTPEEIAQQLVEALK
jgi:hypothetical protein